MDGPARAHGEGAALPTTVPIGGEDVKPWGKIELDYINHDKFRALTSNAICLWHEGKNYADSRHTDGLIPASTAKQFRFFSKKSMELLTRSAGMKPGTDQPYAALWERHDIGFKMHDYLEHNDSREEVLARIAQAEESRDVDRDRLQRWRKAKKVKRETAHETVSETPLETPTETVSETPQKWQMKRVETPPKRSNQNTEDRIQKEEQKSGGGSKRPIYTSDRFVVFEWMLDDLGRMLGDHLDAFDLHQFFNDLAQQSRQQGLVIPKLQVWPWLQAQVLAEAKRRGLPIINGASQSSRPANCRHTDPPCADEAMHTSRYLREQAAS